MKLSARLISLMAALSGETDPAKRAALSLRLAKKSATLAAKSKDGDDDPDDEDDEGDDESEAAKAAKKAEKAKKAAEAAKHRAKKAEYLKKAEEAEEAAKMAEADEEEKAKSAEEEEEKAKAALAAGGARAEALLTKLAGSVAELQRSQIQGTKTSLIDGARKLKAITKTEAAWLAGLQLSDVESFLEMRAKSGLVTTSEEALVKPRHVTPGTEEALPEATRAQIDAAVAVYPLADKKAYRDALVAAHLKAHNDQVRAADGAAGRY